jgi:hypothetical protein
MAASITHLVVGESILKYCYSCSPMEVQGAFLAGCALVDVHAFSDIDRRSTHFVGTVEEDGEDVCQKSCTNFLKELNALLQRPWKELLPEERGFISGYLCHLAVDECWKMLGWKLFQKLGINSWADFVIPGDVSLTTFDFMSREQLMDPPGLDAILEHLVVPDVFLHIPVGVFIRQWNIIREYVKAGGTPEAHFQMLKLAGRSDGEIQETRQRYSTHWANGIQLVQTIGGVKPFLNDGIEHTMQVLPQLWAKS